MLLKPAEQCRTKAGAIKVGSPEWQTLVDWDQTGRPAQRRTMHGFSGSRSFRHVTAKPGDTPWHCMRHFCDGRGMTYHTRNGRPSINPPQRNTKTSERWQRRERIVRVVPPRIAVATVTAPFPNEIYPETFANALAATGSMIASRKLCELKLPPSTRTTDGTHPARILRSVCCRQPKKPVILADS